MYREQTNKQTDIAALQLLKEEWTAT